MNIIITSFQFFICKKALLKTTMNIFENLGFSDKNQLLEMISKKNYSSRSQDLEQFYHDSGQFVSGTKEAWKTKIPFVSGKTAGIVIPRFLAQDIDSEDDWIEAEIKFSVLKMRGLLK